MLVPGAMLGVWVRECSVDVFVRSYLHFHVDDDVEPWSFDGFGDKFIGISLH